ncbi:hypothetical protein BH11PSE11_BH11PSE11_05230 [soil metagenome]
MSRPRFKIAPLQLTQLAILPLALLCNGAVFAAEAPPHIQAEIPRARLAGSDSYRWLGFTIYTANLWVGESGYRSEAPTAAKFALDLRYARALHGAKIAESSLDEIQKLGLGTPEQHRSWRAHMTKIFPDVQSGNHISGIYLPNAGARFYLDGKPLGEVADAEFGRSFFAIWFDPKTSAPALREALLRHAVSPP